MKKRFTRISLLFSCFGCYVPEVPVPAKHIAALKLIPFNLVAELAKKYN